MRYKHEDIREVGLLKLTEQRLVETRYTIVDVSSTFSVRNSVEKVAIVSTFLPNLLHFLWCGLEITKILFTHPWLLVHFVGNVGSGDSFDDIITCLTGTEVWRCVEENRTRIVGAAVSFCIIKTLL